MDSPEPNPNCGAAYAKDIQTRLLFPFLFKTAIDQAAAACQKLKHREAPVWEAPAPPILYSEDLLSKAAGFLFSSISPGASRPLPTACRYLRVSAAATSRWFRRTTKMVPSKAADPTYFVAAAAPGLELFLSPFGAGVLSISLSPDLQRLGRSALSVDEIKSFNYIAAQLRPYTMPLFVIPHPQDESGRKRLLHEDAPPPPPENADLGDRLGALGGEIQLQELRDFLLGPIWSEREDDVVQNQFSVYTVVRLAQAGRLDSSDAAAQLGPLLSGLAQVEEAGHAGSPTGVITVPNLLLNAHHWAAVGFLGAGHLVSDQGNADSAVAFDEQRVPRVRDKYFIPYLSALLQRLSIYRAGIEAGRLVESIEEPLCGDEPHRSLGQLRGELLTFVVRSSFSEVSSREAINRYYDLAREGLRVREALGTLRMTLSELEVAREGKEQGANLRTVAAVQKKLEWLEVFFVSFYASELCRGLGELLDLSRGYRIVSIAAWASGAALVAMATLRPWEQGKEGKRQTPLSIRAMIYLTVIVGVIVAWAAIGMKIFPGPSKTGAVGTKQNHVKVCDSLRVRLPLETRSQRGGGVGNARRIVEGAPSGGDTRGAGHTEQLHEKSSVPARSAAGESRSLAGAPAAPRRSRTGTQPEYYLGPPSHPSRSRALRLSSPGGRTSRCRGRSRSASSAGGRGGSRP